MAGWRLRLTLKKHRAPARKTYPKGKTISDAGCVYTTTRPGRKSNNLALFSRRRPPVLCSRSGKRTCCCTNVTAAACDPDRHERLEVEAATARKHARNKATEKCVGHR